MTVSCSKVLRRKPMLSKRLNEGKLGFVARTNRNDSSRSSEMVLNDYQVLKPLHRIINYAEFLLGTSLAEVRELKWC